MSIKLNIHEAKTHLSHYLGHVKRGGRIVLCRRNEPVAEIAPLKGRRKHKRPVGLEKGRFHVPPEFFDPLPQDILLTFP